ncbi:hypothetical protein KC330_g44 [Hortaea werneckii]|nr:hypothetical protein KC330_g44 [Hortaea werneckii]
MLNMTSTRRSVPSSSKDLISVVWDKGALLRRCCGGAAPNDSAVPGLRSGDISLSSGTAFGGSDKPKRPCGARLKADIGDETVECEAGNPSSGWPAAWFAGGDVRLNVGGGAGRRSGREGEGSRLECGRCTRPELVQSEQQHRNRPKARMPASKHSWCRVGEPMEGTSIGG